MATAKDLVVMPISCKDARTFVKRVHYSGKVVGNSQLHLGVFLGGRLEGVMQFGPSMDKRKIQGLVRDTGWNGFLELNRMAFSETLPRNSESRALAVAFRLIRKHYPHIEWVVSFANAAQCGDGAIYRASGFLLTGMSNSACLIRLPSGEVVHRMTCHTNPRIVAESGGGMLGVTKLAAQLGGEVLVGYQLRYIYFLNPLSRDRLTVPVLPFSKIEELGAGMYRGEKLKRAKEQDTGYPPVLGGATPTRTLQFDTVDVGMFKNGER